MAQPTRTAVSSVLSLLLCFMVACSAAPGAPADAPPAPHRHAALAKTLATGAMVLMPVTDGPARIRHQRIQEVLHKRVQALNLVVRAPMGTRAWTTGGAGREAVGQFARTGEVKPGHLTHIHERTRLQFALFLHIAHTGAARTLRVGIFDLTARKRLYYDTAPFDRDDVDTSLAGLLAKLPPGQVTPARPERFLGEYKGTVQIRTSCNLRADVDEWPVSARVIRQSDGITLEYKGPNPATWEPGTYRVPCQVDGHDLLCKGRFKTRTRPDSMNPVLRYKDGSYAIYLHARLPPPQKGKLSGTLLGGPRYPKGKSGTCHNSARYQLVRRP